MSIVPLRKLTLIGRDAQRPQVLEDLQHMGCMHIIDLPQSGGRQEAALPIARELRAALRYLESCHDHRPAAVTARDFDRETVVRQTLENEQTQLGLRDQRRELREAIEQLAPWGEFQRPSTDELAGQQLWFYRVRHWQADAFRRIRHPSHLVSRDVEFEYWLVISPEEVSGLPVPPLDLGTRPLSALQQSLDEVDRRLEQLELERIALTKWISQLRAELSVADDLASRIEAARRTISDTSLFALQGWVPETAVAQIQAYSREQHVALTVESPQPEETPPTLLRNSRFIAGAEDAVMFYVTPGYRAWDPTAIRYVSFSLFFAMIMADAGYGIVLGILLLVLYKRLGKSEDSRRFRSLASSMVAMTIGYGILIGSYFGMSPAAGSWLDRLVWKTGGVSIMENREAMMFLAAVIGVAHLTVANLIMAWQRRGAGRAVSYLGWALALISSLVMAVAKLPAPPLVPWLADRLLTDPSPRAIEQLGQSLWQWGIVGLSTGLLGVFLFASERPLFSKNISDWVWRPIDGLLALTNLSKAFGDALSYLRLFALGLASAQLAVTFNDLAAQASAVRGVGLLLGTLIFLLGHGLNLVLGIVGGVVHGLRLNCIEFFSWSLTDEGLPFRAFRKKANS